MLQIPYPRRDFRYSMVWPLAEEPLPSAAAEKFRAVAADKANVSLLLKAYADSLDRSIANTASFGLYIPVNSSALVKKGEYRSNSDSTENMEIPSILSLCNDNRTHRQAWWGTVQAALGETGDPGLVAAEQAVVIVPIRLFGRENDETWGLVRIGIPALGGPEKDDLQSAFGALEKFTDGIPSMIQQAMIY